MNGPEIVKAYNTLALKLGKPGVKRFKNLATAQRRLAELEKTTDGVTLTSMAHPHNGAKYQAIHGHRLLIINALKARGTMAIGAIAKTLYGSDDKSNRGKAKLVMLGVAKVAPKMGCTLIKTGKGAESSYGLADQADPARTPAA